MTALLGSLMPHNRYQNESDKFLKNAAFVRREFIGRNDSVEFRRTDKENRIIYVFDTDIIVTKCAPWIKGPATENGNGYGEIFSNTKLKTDHQPSILESVPNEDDSRAEIVAAILSEYILKKHRSQNNRAPIFQFPDHSIETDNVYRAVRRKVEEHEIISKYRSTKRSEFELARTVALIRSVAEGGSHESNLETAISRIIDLITYHGYKRTKRALHIKEWDNYFGLESEYGGIFKLSEAPHFLDNSDEIKNAFSVLDEGGRSVDEKRTYTHLYDYWEKRLRKNKGKAKPTIPADANALTQLFLVNSRLAATKTRVVFVTGDFHLTHAAYGGIPRYLVDTDQEELARNFSISHIRHLWAFTGDALIERGREDKLIDIFGGLLAKWSSDLVIEPASLETIVLQSKINSDITPKDVDDVLAKWGELTFHSIRQYSTEKYKEISQVRHAIASRVQKAILADQWEDLVGLLREDVDRIRDRTVLAMSDLGIDAIIKAHKVGRRNPPELIFDSLTNTNNIFGKLARVNGYSDVKSFESDFGRIKDDCHEERSDGDDRQVNHLKFLVLGAAFASADKWMIAYSHARKAISIVERSRVRKSIIPVRPADNQGDPVTYMSGREAYFLAAVSQRVLASNPDELDKAETFLSKAENALQEDHQQKTAKRLDGRRYQNENLALLLSRYYLARSSNEQDYCDSLATKINQNVKKALDIFLDSETANGKELLGDVTKIGLATNIIQTFVISDFRRFNGLSTMPPCPITIEHIKDAVMYLEKKTSWKKPDDTCVDVIGATKLICTYAELAELFVLEYHKELSPNPKRLLTGIVTLT